MLLFLFTIQCVYFLYFPLLLCNIKRLSLSFSLDTAIRSWALFTVPIYILSLSLSLSLLQTWYIHICDLVSLLLLLAVSFYFGGYRLASCFVILLLLLLVLRIDRTGPTFFLQYTTQKGKKETATVRSEEIRSRDGHESSTSSRSEYTFFLSRVLATERVEDVCFI
jgi:hypothetical protein